MRRLLSLAGLGLVGYVLFSQWPEIQRYLKMKSM